jgi:hypothetical protein
VESSGENVTCTAVRRRQPRKPCKDCGAVKALSAFHRHPNTRDGRVATCRLCKRRYDAERQALKAEAIRAYRKTSARAADTKRRLAAWLKTPAGRESRRITRRIYRAHKRAQAVAA